MFVALEDSGDIGAEVGVDGIEVEGASNLVASGEELVVGFERSEIWGGDTTIAATGFARCDAGPTDELGGGAGRSIGRLHTRNSVGIVVPIIVSGGSLGVAGIGVDDTAVDVVI